jgi:hypothetical protein
VWLPNRVQISYYSFQLGPGVSYYPDAPRNANAAGASGGCGSAMTPQQMALMQHLVEALIWEAEAAGPRCRLIDRHGMAAHRQPQLGSAA